MTALSSMARRGAKAVGVEAGEVGQYGGVDAVGLGEQAAGLGKTPHVQWVDARDRESSLEQRRQQRTLVAAGGFDDDERDLV